MSHGQPKRNKLMDLAASPLNSTINVTPFVDVCLVLLIIFMVVTPMIQTATVELPRTKSPEKTEKEDQIKIGVRGGNAYIGKDVVRPEDLVKVLKAKHEDTPNAQIAVMGDKSGVYGDVMKVLFAAREAGFEQIGLITEPEDRSEAMRRIKEDEGGN